MFAICSIPKAWLTQLRNQERFLHRKPRSIKSMR